jgi:organic radical activating enzyme
MKLKCNCCDGIYNSLDVHFTSACDNNCAHCIDKCYAGLNINRPDVDKIINSIISHSNGIDDILFLGGEPCLYLDELIYCIKELRKRTSLKLYVTTSVPKTCYDNFNKFVELIELLDGINLSVQHYDESIADQIRQTKSEFDRQLFYSSLPYKEKIRINLNIVKPFLYTKEDIINCLNYYDKMGFNSIKLSEIQHGKDVFVSFEKTFNLNLGSPYSNGCQTYLDMNKIIPGFKTPVLLKRSCFICEETLKASITDGFKVLSKFVYNPKNKYGIVYEDGSITKGWI